jgi:RNA polymerase sigma-70 factor (ECF subfamily)
VSSADDLELARACAQGDVAAIAEVEAAHFQEVRRGLGRMRLSSDEVDEVLQGLRVDMFVRTGDRPPRIAEYEGRGSLGAWLRVCATRAALKRIGKQAREIALDEDALLEERAPGDDPELAFLKTAYRAEFKAAFQQALVGLADRERTLLRQHLVDGLSIEEIAALYAVHRATADRWLSRAEEMLMKSTRRALMEGARISREECESMLRLVRSQLGATIRRRLNESR